MEIETKIREFVAQNLLFSSEGVSLEDNASFLQQGVIDSLGVVELVSFASREFGVQVGPGEVIPGNFDSVSKLATFIRRKQVLLHPEISAGENRIQQNTAEESSIVEIQSGGSKSPLFLVHGVGGGMLWGYSNLARHLGSEQPVYAFKSRGLDGMDEFTRIEDMAAQYVADLRKFHPVGPYDLGGYCFGGNVAFEMARQLIAQNQKVGLLLLINCWPNNSSYTRLNWTPAFLAKAFWNFCYRLGHQIRWGAKKPRDFFKWRAAWLRKRFRSFFSRNPDPEVTVEDIVDLSGRPERERQLWRTHVHAWLQYQPQPCETRLVLFRTRGHPVVCSFDNQMGWGPYAAGGVVVKLCPGEHETILEEQNIPHVARELKNILTEIENTINDPRPVSAPKIQCAPSVVPALAP